jgi:hypothetical protein
MTKVETYLPTINWTLQADRLQFLYKKGVMLHEIKDAGVYGNAQYYFDMCSRYAGMNPHSSQLLFSLGYHMDFNDRTYRFLHQYQVVYYHDSLTFYYGAVASNEERIDIKKYEGTSFKDYYNEIKHGCGTSIIFSQMFTEPVPYWVSKWDCSRTMIYSIDVFSTTKLLQ